MTPPNSSAARVSNIVAPSAIKIGANDLFDANKSTPGLPLRQPGSRHFKPKAGFSPVGIAVMVGAHALLGYALVSGMASKAIEIIKKPLDATIIAEVKLPPPPPPPPPLKIEKIEVAPKQATPPPPQPPAYVPPSDVAPTAAVAPAITAVQTTQAVAPAPAVPSPAPAPPALAPPPPAPVPPPAAPVKADMALVCPKQVKPEIPKKAIDDGIEGTVRAEARVRSGKVVDVRIVSGPRAYHAAVRAALAGYECNTSSDQEVVVTQDFNFKFE